ncbi:hypothetical protein HID58_048562 [Brassica napus]|uniref:Uncharacterized protein n=1 Tax=Brassica napus TaxID=3708 RepID=A0ABQ8B2G5_BRANA|nr:hypothetical protein HID58_048562 [Brassica napus]
MKTGTSSTPKSETLSSGSDTRIATSSGSSYFFLQTATSSAPITEGGPIGRYRLPPTGEALLATIALGSFDLAARSREESEESIDSVGATLDLLDLTLLPMEEESGERPDSVFISRAEGRKDLKVGKREGENEDPSRDLEITRKLREGEKRKLKESGGIRGVESKTLETLYTRRGGKTTREYESRDRYRRAPPFLAKILDQNTGTIRIPLTISPAQGISAIRSPTLPPFLKAKDHSLKDPWILPARTLSSPHAVQNPELQPRHLQKIKETTTRLRSNTKESILTWQDQWNGVLPKANLLRISNPGYSPTAMTKSRNKGQTVGKKYSGRTQTLGSPIREHSRSPLKGTPTSVPGTELPSKNWKTSDKENLSYFRIWKSLT